MAPDHVGDLLRRLPARPLLAMRVLEKVGDEEASLSLIAATVAMDPALSTRVIRLANSAARPGRGSITSVERAVTLLGTSTVQALVAAAAFPLFRADVDLGPEGFWTHALGVAGAAAAAAASLGVSADEAFTAGMLHDVGAAILHFVDADAYLELDRSGPAETRLARERERFGVDHPELGAQAGALWGFPEPLVEAIRDHHGGARTVGRLARAVMVGESVAAAMEEGPAHEPVAPLDRLLSELRLTVKPESLIRDTHRRYERLSELAGVAG